MDMSLIQHNINLRHFLFLSVENTRIDVEKCGNEHSEQMLMLLALLQDNRRRRGSLTGANDDEKLKDEQTQQKSKRTSWGWGMGGIFKDPKLICIGY